MHVLPPYRHPVTGAACKSVLAERPEQFDQLSELLMSAQTSGLGQELCKHGMVHTKLHYINAVFGASMKMLLAWQAYTVAFGVSCRVWWV